MNLTACEKCGVVLDANVLQFPEDIRNEDYSVDTRLGAFDNDRREWVPYVKCPVCSNKILKR